MTEAMWAQLAGMTLLLVGSAFFSGSETALFGLSRVKRKAMERRKDPASRQVVDLLSAPRLLLITILLGNTFVNVALSALGTSFAEHAVGGERAVGVAIFSVAALLLLVGEVLPKVMAVRFGETFSLRVAPALHRVHRALDPLVTRVARFMDWLLRSLPSGGESPYLTSRELTTLLRIGEEGGVLQEGEAELVEGILALRETEACEVMTPRVEIVGLKFDPRPEDIPAAVRAIGRRVLPLFGEDKDDVLGILRARAYLLAGEGAAVEDYLVEPYYVPEGKKLADLLEDFRSTGISSALVLDEYGGLSGLITLEDLLEEIFGEVYDRGEVAEAEIRPHGDGFRILGKTALTDVEEELDHEFEAEDDEEVSTLAGLVMAQLGRMPRRGDEVDCGPWRFRVAYVVRRRVVSVDAVRRPEGEAE